MNDKTSKENKEVKSKIMSIKNTIIQLFVV